MDKKRGKIYKPGNYVVCEVCNGDWHKLPKGIYNIHYYNSSYHCINCMDTGEVKLHSGSSVGRAKC